MRQIWDNTPALRHAGVDKNYLTLSLAAGAAGQPRKAIGIDSGGVPKAIRLTWLSPKIIHEIIIGEVDISMQTLRRSFPIVWSKQEKELR